MLENYNTYKILRVFFDSPTKNFQLREISRMIGIGLPSVISHIKKLEKEGFVKKEKKGVYGSYSAKKEEKFKLYKRNDILVRLQECGLIDFIADEVQPNVVVLFGSAARGEDIEGSDIDLFVLAKEVKLDLSRFENKLKRKIKIFFEDEIKEVPNELLNNIINGIKLYGYLKVL